MFGCTAFRHSFGARGLLFILAFTLSSASLANTRTEQGSALTSVRQVRSLSLNQAKLAQPVRVRGLVMVLSGWKNSFFFQDASGGISVDRRDANPELRSGDEVEITGESAPGLFAPVIISHEIRVLGHRGLPAAAARSFEQLVGGQEDSQWVEIRGIVRSAAIRTSWEREVLFLEINTGGGSISVRVHDFPKTDPRWLVDAEVSVRGVCGTNFNERRQFVGLRLFVRDLADVHVLRAAALDPFSLSAQSLDSILRFGANGQARHRIEISGIVTYHQRGRSLYIQEGSQGIYVETEQNNPVVPGDYVEVVGFSAPGSYSPMIQSAIFRVTGHGYSVPPIPVDAAKVIAPNAEGFLTAPYDGLLVKIRGKLLERLAGPEAQILLLLEDKTPFRARLNLSSDHDPLAALENGSLLELTGVCVIRTGEDREPRAFELQLRSSSDVVLLKAPAWWGLKHTLEVLGMTLLVVVATIAWIALLHQRVKAQTSVIQQQVDNLKQSEERFRLIVSNVRDYAIFMLDPTGHIISWNEGAQRIFGYPADEVMGQHVACLYLAEDAQSDLPAMKLREATENERSEDEGWRLRKDGSRFWANVITTALRDDAGRLRGFGRVTRDITERKRAEEAAQRSHREQIQVKDQLLAHVSHELRTPVAAISWFAGNLAEGLLGDLNREQLDHLEGISRNGRQLSKMIDDLLNSARAESGKLTVQPHAMDAVATVKQAIASCQGSAEHKCIALRVDVGMNVPLVWADPQRTNQVLINLIDNAIKFTPEDSTISVGIRLDGGEPDFVCVTVTDAGPGISLNDQERIFARLVQLEDDAESSRRGLGLGLYISKELITRQGGKISVKSTPGQGAAFSFTLPVLSIDRFAATLLSPKNLQVGSFGLITVKPFPASVPRERSRLLAEMGAVLQGCILSDLDILLPRFDDNESCDPFFVLVCADNIGLGVISKRIEGQLATNELLREAEVSPSVDSERLDITLPPGSSRAEWLDQIVAKVNDRILLTTHRG